MTDSSPQGAQTSPASQASKASNPAPAQGAPAHHRKYSTLVLILALFAAAGLAAYLYVPSLYVVSTNDAYVSAHIVSVVPRVSAHVATLHVDDNTKVKAGDLLVELDPRDFRNAVDAAKADLESAMASAANIDAQKDEQKAVITQNEASLEGDKAALDYAQQQLKRYSSLAHTGAGSEQNYQQAQSDIGQKQAALQRDQAAVEGSKAHLAVLDTQRRQAQAAIDRQQAALAQAELNLSYTRIMATETGSVANKVAEAGNFVQPGQALFSIVPEDLFVTANYKETQLTRVRPGQAVTIRVDAFPGQRLSGRVDSIQRGTGAQFALLPPENATGNFVKVVQRVPVKITLDDPGKALLWISPGMSVETTVTLEEPPDWLAWIK